MFALFGDFVDIDPKIRETPGALRPTVESRTAPSPMHYDELESPDLHTPDAIKHRGREPYP